MQLWNQIEDASQGHRCIIRHTKYSKVVGRGGGLSLYISNVFKSKVIHPCTISLQTIENLFIETVKKNYRLLIILIYRPPSTNATLLINKMSELLSIISGNGYDEIILCGDFNLHILNYDNIIITKTH